MAWEVTAANVHDSQALETLVADGDGTLYADSAYQSEEIGKMLEKKGIENQIHERGYRDNPLSEAQKALNRLKSAIRARVEHVNGRFALFRAERFRRVGILRAIFETGLGNLVDNMDLCARLGCRA